MSVSAYAGSAIRFGGVGAMLGMGIGLYAAYTESKRRTMQHLGLPDLLYLDGYADLVYALSCLRDRSRVDVTELATALNSVAQLDAQVESGDTYVGALKFHVFRQTGQIYGMLTAISAGYDDKTSDPDFRDHLETIQSFCDDTRHNQAAHALAD